MNGNWTKNVGLASRYTSYVAVDPKANKALLKESWMMMKSRDIPVQVAVGWHGGNFAAPQARMMRSAGPMPPMPMQMSFNAMASGNSMPMSMMMMGSAQMQYATAPMAKRSCVAPSMPLNDTYMSISQEKCEDEAEDEDDGMAVCDSIGGDFIMAVAASSPPTRALTDDEKLKKLVDTQSFNGAFKVESNLAELLNITLDEIKAGENNLSLIYFI